MSDTTEPELSGVPATLLIPLYLRAIESRRPDALIKDERAEALISRLDEESLRKTLALTEDSGRVVLMLKTLDLDRITLAFLAQHPDAAVLHIGCGLDTRFERVDNGRVEWFDLDLPEVIELRRRLVGDEGARHHTLACSVLERGWQSELGAHGRRPVLFVAEGVFMYFDEAQVKSLVLSMHESFAGAELVFDAYSPFLRWSHNARVARTKVGAPLRWALRDARDPERWSAGIRLLDARYPFQYPEPRLRRVLKVRLLPIIGKGIGVFHYQL